MTIEDEIKKRAAQGPRTVIEQEARVQCIWCGVDTEPTGEACQEHVMTCQKHPTGISVRFLRLIARGDADPIKLANHALFCITRGKEGSIDVRFLI